MKPVMYGIIKMIEYKVEIIAFLQKFHDFYTYLSGQSCKMPKSFNGQRYRCGIYCTLFVVKTTFLCTFVANNNHRSTEAVFLDFLIVCLQ